MGDPETDSLTGSMHVTKSEEDMLQMKIIHPLSVFPVASVVAPFLNPADTLLSGYKIFLIKKLKTLMLCSRISGCVT